MQKLPTWIGRAVFVFGLVVSLGFGAQQALASGPGSSMLACDGYCPEDEQGCSDCCQQMGASGGQCVGDLKQECACLL